MYRNPILHIVSACTRSFAGAAGTFVFYRPEPRLHVSELIILPVNKDLSGSGSDILLIDYIAIIER